MKRLKKQYWFAIVGPVRSQDIPFGGDAPLRSKLKEGMEKLGIDTPPSTGWGLSRYQVKK